MKQAAMTLIMWGLMGAPPQIKEAKYSANVRDTTANPAGLVEGY